MLCTCPVKISCQSQEMLLISINVTVFCEVKKFQMQSSATYVPRSHFWWTARPSQPRTGWTRRPRVSNPSDSRLDVTHTLHSCATINRMRKNTHIPLFYTYKYNSIICIVYIYIYKLQRTSALFSRPTHVRHRTVACCMCIFSCGKWAIVFKVEK